MHNTSIQRIENAWSEILSTIFNGDDWKHDPNFAETPRRIAVSLLYERCAGLNGENKVRQLLSVSFPTSYDGMVVTSPIGVSSLCPHHFENVSYKVCMGYIPKGKLIGLSKIGRVIRLIAKQPIMQEDYTKKIADVFWNCLEPEGLGVIVKGQHMCMTARGLEQEGVYTTTSEVRGWFRDKSYVKDEFLKICQF